MPLCALAHSGNQVRLHRPRRHPSRQGGLALPHGGERTFLTGDLQPQDGRTIHRQIEETGAPALLLDRYAGRLEHHAPWHVEREVSHLFRGLIDAREANELLAAEGTPGCAWSTTGRSGPTPTHSI